MMARTPKPQRRRIKALAAEFRGHGHARDRAEAMARGENRRIERARRASRSPLAVALRVMGEWARRLARQFRRFHLGLAR